MVKNASIAELKSKTTVEKIDDKGQTTENELYLVQSNGYPWSITKQEIIQFFNGVEILNGSKGIHFIIQERKNKCNKVYLQLASKIDYEKALTFTGKKLDGYNIEVIIVKNIEKYHRLISQPNYPAIQNVLRLGQLPIDVTREQIKNFFKGLFNLFIDFNIVI